MAAAGASSQASSSSGAGAGAARPAPHGGRRAAPAAAGGRRPGASGAPVTLQDFEIAKAVGEGDMKRLQTHVQAWLQRWIPFSDTSQQLSTQSIIRAQLGRGIWRGNLAGDFLPNPKIIEGDVEISTGKHQVLGVMGDGNCFYRALGVAMLLHPRLSRVAEEHLARVRYTRPTPEQMRENQIQAFRDTSMGLSMAYPLPGTALDMDNEIGRWRKDHYRLLRFVRKYNSQWGRTKRYSSTGRRLDFVERVARKFNARVWMDAALVRAMREMCATAMESAGAGAGAGATRQSVVEDAVTFDALRTGDMNVSPGVNIQAKIRCWKTPCRGTSGTWCARCGRTRPPRAWTRWCGPWDSMRTAAAGRERGRTAPSKPNTVPLRLFSDHSIRKIIEWCCGITVLISIYATYLLGSTWSSITKEIREPIHLRPAQPME